VPGYDTWTELENAPADERERNFILALDAAKHERTILSPAEALNVITVGAQHHDSVETRPQTFNAIDPFQSNSLPNLSSGLASMFECEVLGAALRFRSEGRKGFLD
jgi:hypothetical protein